ncbi:MAG: T9SS type A sorting domain-containing protein [Flavipsychrobacter sp.]|nr:T9SS type A sorting domain-containing protein [Flavipsychrobacter sp.]
MKRIAWIILLLAGVTGLQTAAYACTNPVLSATHTNVYCYGGNNGTITLSVSGGNPPYTYAWAGPNGFTSNSQNLTGLVAGTYTVTVRGSTCYSTLAVVVTQPTQLTLTASGVACIGSTMNLYANPSGGTAPYTYSWAGPNTFNSYNQNPVVGTVTASLAGNYTVTVTDADLCTASYTAAVGAYLIPNLSTHATYVTCYGGNNGSVSLSVSGGTGFSYLWTGPYNYTSTGQNISNLVAGVYTVNVTSNTGCTASNVDTVLQYPAVVASASSNSPVCAGSALNLNGTGSGGTGVYTYRWSGPSGFSSVSASPVFNPSTVSEAGTYYLTVTDQLQCTSTTSTTVSVTNGGLLTDAVTNVLCNGDSTGAINLTVTGITGSYNVLWTGPNGYYSTTQNITGLKAGGYAVDVSIPQGCIAHTTATVFQANAMQLTATASRPLCNGATLLLTGNASGGVGNASYSWAGPNGFTSSNQNTSIPAITFNGSGLYVLTVKDANSCIKTDTLKLIVDSVPTLSIISKDVLCKGGSSGAILLVPVGSAPFTYAWTGPGGYATNTQNATNLLAGIYNVVATNGGGCSATATIPINEPAVITDTATNNGPLCAGGNLNLMGTAAGGVGNFNYTWSGPNGFNTVGQNPSLITTAASGGVYTLTVKDGNSCIKTATTTVSVVPAPVVVPIEREPLCNGNANGSIALAVTGGIAPINYQWGGPGTFNANTQNINNLVAGIYYVTLTGGCKATYIDTFILEEPAVLNSTAQTLVVCADDTLHLSSQISGGTTPYSYNWTGPGGFVSSAANPDKGRATEADAGVYMLIVHDANNCQFTHADTVQVKALPMAVVSNDTAICAGNSAMLYTITAYPNIWSTGDTAHAIIVTQPGAYIVAIAGQNGCTLIDTISVRVDSTPHVGTIVVTQPTLNGSVVDFTVLNAQFIANYTWYFGDGTAADSATVEYSYNAKGTYSVMLIGSNACGSDTVTTVVVVDTLTGVPVLTAGIDDISIYPNPAQCKLTIDAKHVKASHIRLATVSGSVVYDEAIVGTGPYTVDVSQLAGGLYILYMDTDAGMAVRKVEVMRNN